MTSIRDVLEVYGNGIDADDFAAQLSQAMRRRIVGDPRLLSSHDQHVLASVGVPDCWADRWSGSAAPSPTARCTQ